MVGVVEPIYTALGIACTRADSNNNLEINAAIGELEQVPYLTRPVPPLYQNCSRTVPDLYQTCT